MKTGYSGQTALFVPLIKELGYDIDILAQSGLEGAPTTWEGIKVYNRWAHPWAEDAVMPAMRASKADFFITLLDIWMYEPASWRGAKWCPYFPVDAEPVPRKIVENAKKSFAPITYSKFGYKQMLDAGVETYYVPHAVDTSVYKPIPKAEARAFLRSDSPGGKVWRDDQYVFGMVANNNDPLGRKAFAEHFEAFAMVLRHHPDARLYVHASLKGGYDLRELMDRFGITAACWVPHPEELNFGMSDSYMANVYNGIDCLLSVTQGEGFGVPIIEAQACGTPVIVGDWTAMPELLFNGWKVAQDDATKWMQQLGGCWFRPNPAAIAQEMELAYNETNDPGVTAQTVAVVGSEYGVETVVNRYWKPTLKAIESRIAENANAMTFANAMKAV